MGGERLYRNQAPVLRQWEQQEQVSSGGRSVVLPPDHLRQAFLPSSTHKTEPTAPEPEKTAANEPVQPRKAEPEPDMVQRAANGDYPWKGVVTAVEGVLSYKGPDQWGEPAALPKGTELTVLGKSENWLRVEVKFNEFIVMKYVDQAFVSPIQSDTQSATQAAEAAPVRQTAQRSSLNDRKKQAKAATGDDQRQTAQQVANQEVAQRAAKEDTSWTGIVGMTGGVPLYKAAHEAQPPLVELFYGTPLKVMEQTGAWLQVQVKVRINGQYYTGYVQQRFVIPLRSPKSALISRLDPAQQAFLHARMQEHRAIWQRHQAAKAQAKAIHDRRTAAGFANLSDEVEAELQAREEQTWMQEPPELQRLAEVEAVLRGSGVNVEDPSLLDFVKYNQLFSTRSTLMARELAIGEGRDPNTVIEVATLGEIGWQMLNALGGAKAPKPLGSGRPLPRTPLPNNPGGKTPPARSQPYKGRQNTKSTTTWNAKTTTGKGEGKTVFRSFTSSNFRHNLGKLTGNIPANSQAHHVFPQAKELSSFFSSRGINIHDPKFGSWWNSTSHRKNAYQYNAQWRQWISNNPNANVKDVMNYGRRIMGQYGLPINY